MSKKTPKKKLSTRKSVMKRTKISGSGKVMMTNESSQHRVKGKNARTLARAHRTKVLGTTFSHNTLKMLPYAKKAA